MPKALPLGRPDGVIVSTDADSFADPGWLAGIMREIDAGADAVGGRIVADPDERLLLHPSAELTYLRQVAYDFLIAELEDLIDPDPFDRFPRHANHIGASLAITAGSVCPDWRFTGCFGGRRQGSLQSDLAERSTFSSQPRR